MSYVASKYTRVAPSATTQLISEGESIQVHGVFINSTGAGLISFFEADGVTPIIVMQMLANNSFEIRTKFIAPRGLSVTTASNNSCTIFHSSGGA